MEQGYSFPGGSTPVERAQRRGDEIGDLGYGDGPASRLRQALRGVVETEILPRLKKAHGPGTTSPIPATSEDIEAFGRQLLAKDGAAALALVGALREKTSAADPGLLDLLTRTARHLGELWEADKCDFVDVTIGLRRLHLILNTLSAEIEAAVTIAPDAPRVLLMAAPGESHGFGIAMVQFSFRAAGWRAEFGFANDYLSRLRGEWYDLVGLSVSCDGRLATLRTAVETARRASRNPAIFVMAGGPSLAGRAEFAQAAATPFQEENFLYSILSVTFRKSTIQCDG